MDNDTNIKIIRLREGEDIITHVTDTQDGNLFLENPLNIVLKRNDSGVIVLFIPWIPMELVDSNTAIIKKDSITTMVDPKINIIKRYFMVLHELDEYYSGRKQEISDYDYVNSLIH